MESDSRGLEKWSLALQDSKGSTDHTGGHSHPAKPCLGVSTGWAGTPWGTPSMEKEGAGPEVPQVPHALPAAPVPYRSPTPWQPPCPAAPGSP